METRKLSIAGAGSLAAITLAMAPQAQASDAGLRKVVRAQEAKVLPLAEAFKTADSALTSTSSTDSASAATGAFRNGLHGFKIAVTPIKTVSVKSKAGKKQLLTAIREYDLGLVQYQKLLAKVKSGAPKDSVLSSFKKLNKRLNAASVDEAAALKLLNIKLKST